MADGHILVIAPDTGLRLSLVFALETAGYRVTAHEGLRGNGTRYDCLVLDDRAIQGRNQDVVNFCANAQPVILVADATIPWLADWVAGVVEKPIAGNALTEAVSAAIAPPG